MKMIIYSIAICFEFCSSVFGDMKLFELDSIEYTDWKGGKCNITHQPIYTISNTTKVENLFIAGLGTNRITAQCGLYSLANETQIYPMKNKYGDNKSETSGSVWYYTLSDQGVTIIEFQNNYKMVKIYNLGMVPYTYFGNVKKVRN